MDQLCAVAEVSKRTLYQPLHRQGRVDRRMLRRFDPDILPEVFDRADLAPRERLLAAFDVHAPLCRSIAAGRRNPRPGPPGTRSRRDYKKAFAARLTDTAREAGATNPNSSANNWPLLLDGASARSRVLNTETLAPPPPSRPSRRQSHPTAAVPLGAGGTLQPGRARADAATSSAEVDAEWGW